jgi:peptidoglycan/xylan/chitin deacetylase (PgdA/CDA1 family)
MSLRLQMAKVRREVLCALHRRTVALGSLGPIVTFSFDDFPRSALTTGADIIEGFGGRATYYVSMGLRGKSNALGEQFDSTDLRSLVERGHEVASHTFSHLSARKTPFEEFLKDVNHCEKAIREDIDVEPSNNFAYPYGDVTLSVKKQLGLRMKSCRGTCSGLNGPGVDLNLLRANRLYGGVDQIEAAKRLILENEQLNTWLIFYSHDVACNSSQFGCTPALLESVVSFAADHSVRISTVAQVVTKLGHPALQPEG